VDGRKGQENEQNAKPDSYLKDGTREEMGSPAAVAADSAGADPAFFFFGDGVGWGAGVGWVEDEDDEFIPLTRHVEDGEGQEHDGDE
jgi:hypothetical protein